MSLQASQSPWCSMSAVLKSDDLKPDDLPWAEHPVPAVRMLMPVRHEAPLIAMSWNLQAAPAVAPCSPHVPFDAVIAEAWPRHASFDAVVAELWYGHAPFDAVVAHAWPRHASFDAVVAVAPCPAQTPAVATEASWCPA